MRWVPLAMMILVGFAGQEASAAPQTRVCSKYSTILLDNGEVAEVNGAGHSSLSLLIKGAKGDWIFFDSLAEPSSNDNEGLLVLAGPEKTAYRRSHDNRIYAVQQAKPVLTEGKMVKTAVMGVDFMREPLDSPAIVGDNSDIAVIERVLPGVTSDCDLYFVAGQGLVRKEHR